MNRGWDTRRFLVCLGIMSILGVGASAVVSLGLPIESLLHDMFFAILTLGSGILFALLAVRGPHDLPISMLSLGGALIALIPASLVAVPLVPILGGIREAAQLMTPELFVTVAVNAAMGAFLGCVSAVVTAMCHEAWVIRRSRSHEDARPMPDPSRRHR